MSSTILQSADQVTPAWLQTILAADAEQAPTVSAVTVTKTWDTATSHIALLAVESRDASVPKHLFLKRPRSHPANASEVKAYQALARYRPEAPLPRVIHAAHCPREHDYHLLLEDVRATHCMTEHDLPPRVRHAEQIIDTLADMHAYFWDQPCLEECWARFPSENDIRSDLARTFEKLETFLQIMGDRLPPHRRQFLELVVARYPDRLVQRSLPRRHFTFVHRDAHAWNFLVPYDLQNGRALIIDWFANDGCWRAWPGAGDVAYLMTRWWYPPRRRELEHVLLDRYWRRLHALGVSDYAREQLDEDYRLFAIWSLLRPIEESVGGVPWSWYPQLENGFAAVEELRCAELLV